MNMMAMKALQDLEHENHTTDPLYSLFEGPRSRLKISFDAEEDFWRYSSCLCLNHRFLLAYHKYIDWGTYCKIHTLSEHDIQVLADVIDWKAAYQWLCLSEDEFGRWKAKIESSLRMPVSWEGYCAMRRRQKSELENLGNPEYFLTPDIPGEFDPDIPRIVDSF